jgi:hypothetical protein
MSNLSIISEIKNKGCNMMTPGKIVERRQHKRFPVQEGAYALLKKNSSSKLGQIKNISKGGLSLTYIADGEQMPPSFQVDIFVRDMGYCLKEVPSKKILDFHIENRLPFCTFEIRQVGIQFNELNHSQLSQLDNFIRDCTTDDQN